ncbi:MAG: hypothetical protein M9894_16130 [Planctomycetes bacterium]|nr:hypothetical protein [Planctomycetota bacterium]
MYAEHLRTFIAPAGGLEAARLCKLGGTAGQVEYAALGDPAAVVVTVRAAREGQGATCKPLGSPGTLLLTAAAAIAVGQRVSPAANGKAVAGGSPAVAIALKAASGDGAIFEALPIPQAVGHGSAVDVAAAGANVTLPANAAPLQVLTPDAARDVTLPDVALWAGRTIVIVNGAAATHALTAKNAGGDTIGAIAATKASLFFSTGAAWRVLAGA